VTLFTAPGFTLMFEALVMQPYTHMPMNFQPFVITALPRSGSFMLTTALDTHPEIRCGGEALNKFSLANNRSYRNAGEALMTEVYSPERNIKAIGFKLLFDDARKGRFADARKFLVQMPVKVIHLRRRNLLKRYISFLHATKTDVWVLCNKNDRPYSHKLKVNTEELIINIKRTFSIYHQMDDEFLSWKSITIWYEDLVNEYTKEMNRIFAFLNVTNNVKTQPETLTQV